MQTRNRERLPHSQRPQVINLRFQVSVINLIGHQDNGFLHAPEHAHNLLIRGGNTHARIHHKNNNVGLLNCDFRLIRHLGVNTACIRFPAASINKGETFVQPFSFIGDTVAGHPRLILHHGLTPTQNTVNNRGLPHIGAPHDRYHRVSKLLFFLIKLKTPGAQERTIFLIKVIVLKPLQKSLRTRLGGLIVNIS